MSGGTPSTKNSEYWIGDIPWIQSSDLVEHNLSSPTPNKFINNTSIDESSAKLIPKDSIGVVTRVGVGKLSLFDYQYATSQDFISFTELNIDKYFAVYLLYKLLQKEQKYLQGTSIKGITKNDLLSKQLKLPVTQSEQARIGKLLESIDKHINLHQRKLDKLKDLKEVYLQNLLPEKNNRVPNIRFAGFCKEWEKRKLEEIAKITMGQAPKSENYTDKANDYILVQGNADLRDGKVVPRVWTTQITKKAEVGDILISVRAPVGEVGITGFPIVLGRGVASLKGNSFIYQTLKRMKNRNYWKKYSTGSTFESINSKDLKNATIYVPSKKEQSNIGNFCSKLDLMIGLHQEKSDKLNNIKNVYLQKLFV